MKLHKSHNTSTKSLQYDGLNINSLSTTGSIQLHFFRLICYEETQLIIDSRERIHKTQQTAEPQTVSHNKTAIL